MLLSFLYVFVILSDVGCGALFKDFSEIFNKLGPKPPPEVSENAVRSLIKRLVGEQASLFNVTVDQDMKIDDKDTFTLYKSDAEELVVINGSSGVAAAWGFHYYLKEYCKCHISWDGDQIYIPPVLPTVSESVTANDRFRYYQNVCTPSYSFVWWDWPRWERELDWMALNGFNLALAFTAQEEVWKRVYGKLGLTQEEIEAHFSGPAFLSWNRMGNLRGWGGPLPWTSWHVRSSTLQRRILARMRELGITPVLPAFPGHVPRAFKRIFPNASLTLLPKWNSFSDEYCCPYLLSPEDEHFDLVGSLFLKEYIEEFGTDHIYNCDPFNEMVPSSGDPEYLKTIARKIFQSMTGTDPDAVWMLQGWLFTNDEPYWSPTRAQAFLTAIPRGRFLIMDLQAELTPQYMRLESFFGQPFIWCMLHNFGGTLGMHGSVEKINNNIFLAREDENSTMVGSGITPEGINQNYVMYDLMMEMFWRKDPVNLTDWFDDYSIRRYGQINEHYFLAWNKLKESVYNYTGTLSVHGKYILVRHPQLNLRPNTWYEPTDVFEAWGELLEATEEMERVPQTFRVDLVDLTRQALQLKIDQLFEQIQLAFLDKNITALEEYSTSFLSVMDDLETILASNSKFLLGRWINSAIAAANSSQEEILYAVNARNQITLWGPNGEIKDYANKQWSGLIQDYYKPRWEIFLAALKDSLIHSTPFKQKEVSRQIFLTVEQPFTYSNKSYPDQPTGDSISISKFIYGRWIEI